MQGLSFKEKLFCESMSLILAGWWVFLIYLLYAIREYLLIGTFVMVGIAIGIALVEMIRGAKMGISRTTWICQLPGHTQYKIAEELLKRIRQVDESISREEILDGMNGRICDIEEMISFEEIADWM